MRTSIKKSLLVLYLILLVASHFYRKQHDAIRPLTPGQQTLELAEWDHGKQSDKKVTFAYRDLRPENKPDAPVLLLLHGNPIASEALNPLIAELAPNYRLLVPDLPGFGSSSLEVADYSVETHADYLVDFLAACDVEQVHVLAYSMGGGPALHLTEKMPDRVASLIFVSSIGVVEFELLRDYTLNHAVHGVLLFLTKSFISLTPHFGAFDTAIMNVPMARNLYDTDQRKLRPLLENLEKPLLLIHGTRDWMAPSDVAREHRRIVPQSENAWLDDGHMAVIYHPETTAEPTAAFVDKVAAGTALTRADATPDRLAAARGPMLSKRIHGTGLIVMVLLLIIAMQTSEDLTSIGAGLLAAKGVIAFFPAVLGCFLGIILGDSGIYLLGRLFGKPALRHRPLRWFISEKKVARHAKRFNAKGGSIVFSSRFIIGTRVAVFLSAGILGMNFWRFLFWLTLAALIWTPMLVAAAYFVGNEFLHWFEQHGNMAMIGLAGFFFSLWLVINKVIPLFTWKGRRLAWSTFRRTVRWEYWPQWLFYPPVVAYIFLLACKHRSLSVITLANPGIFSGGLVRETKSEILTGLKDASESIATWQCIKAQSPITSKQRDLRDFMEREGLTFPIILKPDIGFRGAGVKAVKNEAEAKHYLENCPADVIAQEYISGSEYGIFYYRYPGQPTGRIFGITEKKMTSVVGDGTKTLEALILDDARAVEMARFFLEKFEDDLETVPTSGEEVKLTTLGTHCRGSIFLDANQLATPALVEKIDQISKTFDGFYFGRYDIRVPDQAALEKGEGIKILELNGLTAEATNVYDPRHPVSHAWKTLMRQWQIAFAIAAQNRSAGHRPMGSWKMAKLLVEFFANPVYEADSKA
jgi:pimeloyl-ACP methyl ester carboxylesterase/membrane protein DedA with SNARE-associated domain